MRTCVSVLQSRRSATATAALACRYLTLSRMYSAPTYPVNSTDLPDPRGTKLDLWRQQQQQQSPSGSNPHYARGGSVHSSEHEHDSDRSNDMSSSSTSTSTSTEGQHTFTKLDLQNPPQMPSPTYYGTYEEYLDAYDHYLQDTAHFTTSARVFVQKRFEKLRAAQADMAEVVRREYLWTFIPLLLCLSVFMVDRSNHSAAAFTHRVIKERTKQQVKKVKWEIV